MMIVMEQTRFLSTAEALERLGVTSPTFNKWVKELGITQYKGAGRGFKYREGDIERIYREKVQLRPVQREDGE